MSRFQRLRWDALLLLVAWVWVFPYSRALNNPNERTRVLQARSLVERGELRIGRVERRGRRWVAIDPYGAEHRYDARRGNAFVNDVALVCDADGEKPPACVGDIYPAKPPGAALLGIPALWLAQSFGVVPAGPDGEVRATWVLRVGMVIPLAALGLWCLSWLLASAGVSRRRRMAVVLATGLGTGLLPYGLMAVGHAIAGTALLFALVLMLQSRRRHGRSTWLWAAVAGHVAGWAVMLEYHSAIAVLALGLWGLFQPTVGGSDGWGQRFRRTLAFGLGGATTAALFAYAHQSMFRSPVRTGHFYLMSAHNRDSQAAGFLGMDGFHLDALREHLVHPYMGLAPLMSWLLIGLVAGVVVVLVRRSRDTGIRAVAGIALVYLVFVATLGQWRTMNGWSVGPRYLAPAMLPLAYLAGLGWDAAARKFPPLNALFSGAAASSIVFVGLVTVAYPSPPNSVLNPFGELALPMLDDGFGVRNLGVALGLGAQSLVPYLLVLAAAAAFVLTSREERPNDPAVTSWSALALGGLFATVGLGVGGASGTLAVIASLPLALCLAVLIDPWVRQLDQRAPWLAPLLAALLVVPSVLPADGTLGEWSESLAFGIPAFMLVFVALLAVLGRATRPPAGGLSIVWVVVAVVLGAAAVVLVSRYTPTDPGEIPRAQSFCRKTVEGALPTGDGKFLEP